MNIFSRKPKPKVEERRYLTPKEMEPYYERALAAKAAHSRQYRIGELSDGRWVLKYSYISDNTHDIKYEGATELVLEKCWANHKVYNDYDDAEATMYRLIAPEVYTFDSEGVLIHNEE